MSFTEFHTTIGFRVHILPIQVSLDKSADLCAMIFNPAGLHRCSYRLSGDEYTNWGSNDNYIKELICDKENWIGRPLYDDSDSVPIAPVTRAQPAPAANYDDTRSVHNDADLAKITTLEEQMVEQQRMVSQLKSILISKGMI